MGFPDASRAKAKENFDRYAVHGVITWAAVDKWIHSQSTSASAEKTKEVLQGLFDQYHEGTNALDFERYWGAVKEKFPDASRTKAKENFDRHAVHGIITWAAVEKWIHSQSVIASAEKTKEVLQGLFDQCHEGTKALASEKYWGSVKKTFPDATQAKAKENFDKHAVAGVITWTEVEKWIHSTSKSASAERNKEVLQGLFDQYHEGTKALDFEKYWGAVKQTFPDATRAIAKENFDKHAVDGVITWTEIEKWIH